MDDVISRQKAIDAVKEYFKFSPLEGRQCAKAINRVPSVKPDSLSDAYMKAVWTWLLNYQVKAAELQGKYTPYEVLSMVANDWRKEHE